MGQVSAKLRKIQGGFSHWCPGCNEMHMLPDSWRFDGNLKNPTFSPSFKQEGRQRVFENGQWTGEWKRDTNGNTIPFICHYILANGQLNFCSDSTHALAGQIVALPDLPEGFTD